MRTSGKIDVDALGQATDTTFGRSSTVSTASYSVKAKQVSEDVLQVDYISTITYAANQPMRAIKQKYDAESESAINETMKAIKAEYKRLTGSTLKVKQSGESDGTIEPVSMSAFSPVRRGYYRRRVTYILG